MGLLDLIFGSKSNVKKEHIHKNKSGTDVSFSGNFISIPSIGFFGQFKASSSGEWIIGWSDSDPGGRIGGHRDSGHGKYVLYNTAENKLALQGQLERPNSADVANNGSFSIEDWHFGSELSGTFYVFSCSGDELIKKKFSANILNSAVSDNGLLAACQTANAPPGCDGDLLVGFSLKNGNEAFSINPPTGRAGAYEFDEVNSRFGVVLKGIGTFFYSSDGVLLEPRNFDLARLRSNKYEISLFASEEIVKSDKSSQELVEEALSASSKALINGAEENSHWKAIALKVKGMAHDRLGNHEEALTAFDAALEINPKVGVKRKADAIRKRLSVKK